MFRIARIRIRRIDLNQHEQAAEKPSRRRLWPLAPWDWRVRVKWVGFGPLDAALSKTLATAQARSNVPNPAPARLLRTFDVPNMKVHVHWLGLRAIKHNHIWTLGLLVAFVWLGLFALTRPAEGIDETSAFELETIDSAGLVFYEANLAGKIIRMSHSRLDIGQSQDIFDNNTRTLIRGREANPFILDFEFDQPQPVSGLVMDFGGMDFDLRVYVYDAEGGKPVLYNGEYRQQPPEPHVEIDFVDGPASVSRIYIEIIQFNPPDEPHIHVREVLFKE